METNSKKLLEAIPDFTKFTELSQEIQSLYFDKMVTENQIKQVESENFKEIMTNPKYFINGKAVPVSYFENAYKFVGLDGELVTLRSRLATIVSSLDLKRMQYDIYKQMIEVWRTASSNERALT